MIMLRYPSWRVGWTMNLMAGLFMALIPCLGHGLRGEKAEFPLNITVHEGKLSVNLRVAKVWDVLAIIGEQSGITILGDPRPETRVSTQFSDIPLDEGLRRLLRLASLSSTMLYAYGPAETVILTAVYVFEEGIGPVPPPQAAAEPPTEDRLEEAGQSFAEALAQLSTAFPLPSQVGEHNGAERFRALLESAQHYAASRGAGEENELARRFRKVLEQPLQAPDDTSPDDLPQMEYRK